MMTKSDDLLLLDSEELILVQTKNSGQNQLMFAIILKFFEAEGYYPTNNDIISDLLVQSLACQLGVTIEKEYLFNWQNRSVERYRQDIRKFLGFVPATKGHKELLINYLVEIGSLILFVKNEKMVYAAR